MMIGTAQQISPVLLKGFSSFSSSRYRVESTHCVLRSDIWMDVCATVWPHMGHVRPNNIPNNIEDSKYRNSAVDETMYAHRCLLDGQSSDCLSHGPCFIDSDVLFMVSCICRGRRGWTLALGRSTPLLLLG